jgi:molybdopterin-containing oxidoreductase family membrane subunit
VRGGGSIRKYAWIGLPVAIAMAGAGGALYATAGGRSYWNSGFLPVIVIVGGLLTASAVLTVLSGVESRRVEASTVLLGRMTLILLVIDLIMEWAEYSIGLYGGGGAAAEATRLVLFGPYAWVFWGVHLVIGSVVPLVLLAASPQKRGSLVLAGLLVVGTYLSVRLNIVIPGLAVPQLEGLETAYMEPGLLYAYAPTLMEWLVALFTVSLAILIFDLGYRWSQRSAGLANGKEA